MPMKTQTTTTTAKSISNPVGGHFQREREAAASVGEDVQECSLPFGSFPLER